MPEKSAVWNLPTLFRTGRQSNPKYVITKAFHTIIILNVPVLYGARGGTSHRKRQNIQIRPLDNDDPSADRVDPRHRRPWGISSIGHFRPFAASRPLRCSAPVQLPVLNDLHLHQHLLRDIIHGLLPNAHPKWHQHRFTVKQEEIHLRGIDHQFCVLPLCTDILFLPL